MVVTSQTSDFVITMTPLCNDVTAVRRDKETGYESSDGPDDTRLRSVMNTRVLCVSREGHQEAELKQQETNDGPIHVDLDVDSDVDLDLDMDVDLDLDLHVDLDVDLHIDLHIDLDLDLDVDLHVDLDLDLDVDLRT